MTGMTETLAYIATVGTTVALIWFLFEKAEETINPDVKKEISTWLLSLHERELPVRWITNFSTVFDSVFGEKHFTWKCFTRSSIASICAMIIMQLFWIFYDPEAAKAFFNKDNLSIFVVVQVILFITINIIPDYFSLLETRTILRWMPDNQLSVITLLLIDLLFTTLIALLSLVATYSAYIIYVGGEIKIIDIVYIKDSAIQFKPFITSGYTPGVFFYTTFLTSIWIWLYIISGIIIKGSVALGSGWFTFVRVFDISDKPIRSLGFVSSFIAFLILSIHPLLS